MSGSLKKYIEIVDSFPYDKSPEGFFDLLEHQGKSPIGLVSSAVAKYFEAEDGFIVDKDNSTIRIRPEYDTLESRNKLFANVGARWKEYNAFESDLKKGWRNELYTVHYPTGLPYLLIERAFSVLLGFVTYGVHINGYVSPANSADGKLKLWIPRRSPTKPTFPGKLDNTVAGGLGYPYGLWETVVKECYEEAGLLEGFVKVNTKSAGVILYMYYPKDEPNERVQPEVEYIYDLEFQDEVSVVPSPIDGEAEDFKLMDVDEVLTRLRNLEFKPNCGLVIIDFLIRHGFISPEIEPDYLEIQSRCHRRMPFATR